MIHRERLGTLSANAVTFTPSLPTGKRWRLLSASWGYLSDAAAADRPMWVIVQLPGSAEYVAAVLIRAHPASSTMNYSVIGGASLHPNTVTVGVQVGCVVGFPVHSFQAGDRVFIGDGVGVSTGDEIRNVVIQWEEID